MPRYEQESPRPSRMGQRGGVGPDFVDFLIEEGQLGLWYVVGEFPASGRSTNVKTCAARRGLSVECAERSIPVSERSNPDNKYRLYSRKVLANA